MDRHGKLSRKLRSLTNIGVVPDEDFNKDEASTSIRFQGRKRCIDMVGHAKSKGSEDLRCTTGAFFLFLVPLFATAAFGQTGDGSLRGYVRDESGAVLPGVTVTATSDVLISAVTVATDGTGYYRSPTFLPASISSPPSSPDSPLIFLKGSA